MTIAMAYTYSTLSNCFRAAGVEIIMFIRAKRSWFRRAAVAATALATVALCTGTLAQPTAAQVYPGYSYPAASAKRKRFSGLASTEFPVSCRNPALRQRLLKRYLKR